MINFFKKEFELMCYIADTRVFNGICTYDEVCDKFGVPLVHDLLVDRNLIGYDDSNKDGLNWTELGKIAMNSIL